MVDLLGHHPSVMLWCGHNAPFAVDREPGEPWTRGARVKLAATTAAADVGQAGARPVGRPRARPPAIAPDRSCGTAACSPASPSAAPTATSTSAGTTASSAASRATLRRWPRLGRFVSEFGAQAVPEHAATGWSPSAGPTSTGTRSRGITRCSATCSNGACRPADAKSFDEWRDDDAGVPGRAAAAADRRPAPPEVRADRRLRACSRSPIRSRSSSWSVLDHERVAEARATPRCATRAGPCSRWSNRAPGSSTSSTTPAPTLRRRRARGRRSTAASRAGPATSPADGIAFVGRVDARPTPSTSRSMLEHPDAGRVAQPVPAARPARGDRGVRRPIARRFGFAPASACLDFGFTKARAARSESPAVERHEAVQSRRGVNMARTIDRTAKRRRHRRVALRRSGRSAGRPADRPVLPIGGRQEVGDGGHRHRPDGLRPRPHDRQPQAVPLEGGAQPLRRGAPRHPGPPAPAHGPAVDVPASG